MNERKLTVQTFNKKWFFGRFESFEIQHLNQSVESNKMSSKRKTFFLLRRKKIKNRQSDNAKCSRSKQVSGFNRVGSLFVICCLVVRQWTRGERPILCKAFNSAPLSCCYNSSFFLSSLPRGNHFHWISKDELCRFSRPRKILMFCHFSWCRIGDKRRRENLHRWRQDDTVFCCDVLDSFSLHFINLRFRRCCRSFGCCAFMRSLLITPFQPHLMIVESPFRQHNNHSQQ